MLEDISENRKKNTEYLQEWWEYNAMLLPSAPQMAQTLLDELDKCKGYSPQEFEKHAFIRYALQARQQYDKKIGELYKKMGSRNQAQAMGAKATLEKGYMQENDYPLFQDALMRHEKSLPELLHTLKKENLSLLGEFFWQQLEVVSCCLIEVDQRLSKNSQLLAQWQLPDLTTLPLDDSRVAIKKQFGQEMQQLSAQKSCSESRFNYLLKQAKSKIEQQIKKASYLKWEVREIADKRPYWGPGMNEQAWDVGDESELPQTILSAWHNKKGATAREPLPVAVPTPSDKRSIWSKVKR
jgi:hypothetical protein